MSWLKETIELSNPIHKKKATAEAKIKLDWDAINMKARMRHLKCRAYARKWQNYKVCMTRHSCFTERDICKVKVYKEVVERLNESMK